MKFLYTIILAVFCFGSFAQTRTFYLADQASGGGSTYTLPAPDTGFSGSPTPPPNDPFCSPNSGEYVYTYAFAGSPFIPPAGGAFGSFQWAIRLNSPGTYTINVQRQASITRNSYDFSAGGCVTRTDLVGSPVTVGSFAFVVGPVNELSAALPADVCGSGTLDVAQLIAPNFPRNLFDFTGALNNTFSSNHGKVIHNNFTLGPLPITASTSRIQNLNYSSSGTLQRKADNLTFNPPSGKLCGVVDLKQYIQPSSARSGATISVVSGTGFFATLTPVPDGLALTGSRMYRITHPNYCVEPESNVEKRNAASAPFATGDTRCGPGSVILRATTSFGSTYKWYSSPTSTTVLSTSTVYTPPVSSSRTYYVTQESFTTCESPRTAVTATVNSVPSTPSGSATPVCGSGTSTFSVSSPSFGTTYTWYTSISGGSSVGTGSSIDRPVSFTTSLYVSATNNSTGCESPRSQVTSTVTTVPPLPSGADVEVCSGEPAVLNAIGSGDIKWYNAAVGGSSVFTGNNFSISFPSTRSYYVSATNANGCESARKEIRLTVTSTPSTPSASNETICIGESVNLIASGGSSYEWYNSSSSVGAISTSASFNVSPTSTTSYFVSAVNGDCKSPRREVTVTVNPLPVQPLANDVNRCGPGSVTLSATGGGGGSSYTWYNDATSPLVLSNSSSYTFNLTGASRTVYVTLKQNGCESSRKAVTATSSSPPSAPSVATPSPICGSGSVTLSATGGGGGVTYEWSTSIGFFSIAHTGSTFNPTVSSTRTYYVRAKAGTCIGPSSNVTATVNAVPSPPITSGYEGCGTSSPAVVTASGASNIRWFFTPTGGNAIGGGSTFTIPVGGSTTVYAEALNPSTGCTSPRVPAQITIKPIPSRPTLPNLSVCTGETRQIIADGVPGATYKWYVSSSGGTAFHTGSSYTETFVTSKTYYVSAEVNQCESDRQSVFITVTDHPDAPQTNDGFACVSGTPVTMEAFGVAGATYEWFFNETNNNSFRTGDTYTITPTSTEEFYVASVVNGCRSLTRTKVSAVLAAQTPSPVALQTSPVCTSGVVELTASGVTGATYEWFSDAAGTNSLASTEVYTTPLLSATTTYYLQASKSGCSSAIVPVQAVVTSKPGIPSFTSDSRCGPGEVVLTASGGSSYIWYDENGNAVGSGASLTVNKSSSVNYELVAVDNTCESDRVTVPITIVDVPSAPTADDGFICTPGVFTLEATGVSGATFTWYSDLTSSTVLASTASFTTPSLSASSSYYVSQTLNGCESQRKEVKAIIADDAGIINAPNEFICGDGTITLTAGGIASATYNWYDASTGGSLVGTGETFETPSFTAPETQDYFVSVTLNGCESDRKAVTASAVLVPNVPTFTVADQCGPGTIELVADGVPGATYRWYENQSDATALFTGATYTTPNLTATTSYYLGATVDGCESVRVKVDAIVSDIPGAPTPITNFSCGPGAVTISASSPVGGVYEWFSSETSTDVLFTGQSFETASISTDTNYWVRLTSTAGCESPRTQVTAFVRDIPTLPTVADADRCGPGTVEFIASGGGADVTYNWYRDLIDTAPVFTGETFTTPSLTANRNYYVATLKNGCESNRVEVEAIVKNVSIVAGAAAFGRCGPGRVELSVEEVPGVTYSWYNNNGDAFPVETGNVFVTPEILASRDYYVAASVDGCEGARVPITAFVNSPPGTPAVFGETTCGPGSVTLKAAGAPTGGKYLWYEAQNLNTPVFEGQDFQTPVLTETTTYYVAISVNECVGDQAAVIAEFIDNSQTPDSYTAYTCGDESVELPVTGVPFASSYIWYDGEFSTNIVNVGAAYNTPILTANTDYWVSAVRNTCEGPRSKIEVIYQEIPTLPVVADVSECSPGAFTLSASGTAGATYKWYTSPTGNDLVSTGISFETPVINNFRQYYVSAEINGCEGPRAEVTIEILPALGAPATFAASTCGPGDVVLRAGAPVAGADLKWYATETSSTALFTGSEFTATSLTSTTTFYVAASKDGCEGERAPVVATVSTPPVAPVAADASGCVGESVTFNASGSGSGATYTWYQTEASAVALATGISYTASGLTAATDFYVAATTNGCEGPRTKVTANVVDKPAAPTASGLVLCEPGDATVIASGIGSAVYSWYENATGGTSVATGASYTLNDLATNKTLYVAANVAGCEGPRTQVQIEVRSALGAPATFAASTCGPGDVVLRAGAPVAGADLKWYATETSSTALFTGSEFTATSLTSTTTFYVAASKDGCEGERAPVVATVSTPPVAPVAADASGCVGESVTFNASGSGSGATYTWYQTEASAVALATGISYTASGLTAATDFYVAATTNGCEGPRTKVTANVVDKPAAPTASGLVLCEPGDATVIASGIGSAVYSWYENATGGTSVATGASYTLNDLATNKTLYVAANVAGCEGPRTQVQIEVRSALGAPATFAASTCGPGDVVLRAGAPVAGADLKWYATETSSTALFTGSEFTATSLTSTTTFYVAASKDGCEGERAPVVATVSTPPVAPVAADASGCVGESVTFNASGSGSGATYTWYQTEASAVALATGISYTASGLTAATDFYVAATTNGCEGPRTKVTANVVDKPAAPTASGLVLCEPGDATVIASGIGSAVYSWYENATGGTSVATGASYTLNDLATNKTLYVAANVAGCEGPRTQVQIEVRSALGAPATFAASTCGPGDVVLRAGAPVAGADLKWYATETSSTALFTGSEFTATSLTSTTTFYVAASKDGCEGERAPVVATVSTPPVAPVAADASGCVGESVTFNASGSGSGATYTWYQTEASAVALATGISYTASGLTAATDFYVAATTNGCEGPRTKVTANVVDKPAAPTASGLVLCEPGDATVIASGIGSAVYSWYENATGGTSVATGASYTLNDLATNKTLYVAANVAGCEGPRTQVQIEVRSALGAPATFAVSTCGPGDVVLRAGAPVAGADLKWYATETSSTALFTGSEFTATSLTSTTTFYVAASKDGCEGERAPVVATVTAKPALPVVENQTACFVGQELSFEATGNAASFNWYATEFASNAFYRGRIYLQAINATSEFYVSAVSGGGCESERIRVVATLAEPIPAPIAPDVTRCGPGEITLLASGVGGADYLWFTSENADLPTHIGNEFTTGVQNSGVYFVSAVLDGCQSPRTRVTARANVKYTAPLVDDVVSCSPGEFAIVPGSRPEDAVYRYYTSASTDDYFAEGDTLFTGRIETTTSFYVSVFNGCEGDRVKFNVIISDQPSAPTVSSSPSCGPGAVTAVADSVSGYRYIWTLPGDDFVIGSGSVFTTPLLEANTNFEVKAINQNGCVSEPTLFTASIVDIPTIEQPSDLELCQNSNPFLLDDIVPSDNTFIVNGPGVIDGTFYAQVAGLGEHIVSYTIANTVGCSYSFTRGINVTESVDLDLGNLQEVCLNASIIDLSNISNVPGGTWAGPGVVGDRFDAAMAGIGNHRLTYSVNSNGCSYAGEKLISVQPLPNDFVLNQNSFTVCEGGTIDIRFENRLSLVAYTFHTIDGGLLASNSYSTTVDSSFVIIAKAVNEYGCEVTQEVPVNVAFDTFDFTVDQSSISQYDLVKFSTNLDDTNGYTFRWNFGDGETSPLPSPAHYYNTAGSFDVELTITNHLGCSFSIEKVAMIDVAQSNSGVVVGLPGKLIEEQVFVYDNGIINVAVFKLNFDELVVLSLVNAEGKVLLQEQLSVTSGSYSYDLPSNIPSGIYFLKTRFGTTKFVKQ